LAETGDAQNYDDGTLSSIFYKEWPSLHPPYLFYVMSS